jgi:hypothetical protein
MYKLYIYSKLYNLKRFSFGEVGIACPAQAGRPKEKRNLIVNWA